MGEDYLEREIIDIGGGENCRGFLTTSGLNVVELANLDLELHFADHWLDITIIIVGSFMDVDVFKLDKHFTASKDNIIYKLIR